MIGQYDDKRSLYAWLVMQEKILKLWIEEVLAAGPKETDFITKPEQNQAWIADQIDARS